MQLDEYLFKNRRQFSAKDFAKKIGCNNSYLSKLCLGHCTPSLKLARLIEEHTNGQCTWKELMQYALDEKEKRSA